MLGLLDLQLLADLQTVRVDARIQVLDGLERDAVLLGDAAEVVALRDDVFARAGRGGGLAGASGLRSSGDLLEGDDGGGEFGFVLRGLFLGGGEVGLEGASPPSVHSASNTCLAALLLMVLSAMRPIMAASCAALTGA